MKKGLMTVIAVLSILGFTGLAQADFVGNKDSKTFHTDQCPVVKQMKDANKISFPTAAQALKDGYVACKKCSPADVDTSLVGSKDSDKYHKTTCRLAANIKQDKKISFADQASAEKAGYKPCAICFPADKK